MSSGDAAVPVSTRRASGAAESVQASRRWWDAEADAYLAEHASFLGDSRFVWGPEGLAEDEAKLLGNVDGRRVVEVGAGAAQCSRWLLAQGARPVAVDLSSNMLAHARRLGRETGLELPLVQADAQHLPFRDATFDLACSAFGAVPFVADSAGLHREVARVLHCGGRWVFSTTHPMRWAFADDPGRGGLVVQESYFDRRAYVEEDAQGVAAYVEHHRTVGDRVREIVAAGLTLVDLVEPDWPEWNTSTWGQWSPLRGRLFPGTAIFVCAKPA